MRQVDIPMKNSKKMVKVDLDQLPMDATHIIAKLKAGQAPLRYWIMIAREYFQGGKIDSFLRILLDVSTPEIVQVYTKEKDIQHHIKILNCLGTYYTFVGTKEREDASHFIMATEYFNRASSLMREGMHVSTNLGKGHLLLAMGDFDQALSAFEVVLDDKTTKRKYVALAFLGQAFIHLNKAQYSDSLVLYQRALVLHPDCRGIVRLGMGLIYYKIGNHNNALKEFEHVLRLDPKNIEALVAHGILKFQPDEAGGFMSDLEKKLKAFEIYPSASSLNYLADHFFFTGQFFLLEPPTGNVPAVTTNLSQYLQAFELHPADYRLIYIARLAMQTAVTSASRNPSATLTELRGFMVEIEQLAKLFQELSPYEGVVGMRPNDHVTSCKELLVEIRGREHEIIEYMLRLDIGYALALQESIERASEQKSIEERERLKQESRERASETRIKRKQESRERASETRIKRKGG